jgi:2-ketocyclohexanecarboxyl-CoA hydrolase
MSQTIPKIFSTTVKADGVATITINRPDKYNAFRGQHLDELIHAFNRPGWDKSIGVIVLTGAGEKAFCTGGDQIRA